MSHPPGRRARLRRSEQRSKSTGDWAELTEAKMDAQRGLGIYLYRLKRNKIICMIFQIFSRFGLKIAPRPIGTRGFGDRGIPPEASMLSALTVYFFK